MQLDPEPGSSTRSDTPFEADGAGFRNGRPGGPGLLVWFASPTGLHVTAGAASVKAPGPPGSIENGPSEERGYVLTATAPAATTFRFDVALSVQPTK